jgi:esterase/lipase
VDHSTAETLTKNIWELHRLVESGEATVRSRQMLLRALAQQVDYLETAAQIPPEQRAFLLEREDSRSGVLLIHGTEGSPADLRNLGETLFEAGHNVYCMRLPGVGTSVPSGVPSPWESYREEVANRYSMFSECCKQVYVVGHGFGATLALMNPFKPRPEGLVLLAPALHARVSTKQRVLMALGLDRLPFLRRHMGWRSDAFDGMEAARKNKSWSRTPAFVAAADDDERVDARSIGFLQSRMTHHRTVIKTFPRGGHRFHLGDQQQEIQNLVREFLKAN